MSTNPLENPLENWIVTRRGRHRFEWEAFDGHDLIACGTRSTVEAAEKAARETLREYWRD